VNLANKPFIGRNGLQTDQYLALGSNNITVNTSVINVSNTITINTSTIFVGNSSANSIANSTYLKIGTTFLTNSTHTTITGNAAFSGTVSDSSANVVSQTLTDGATISWNAANGRIASVTLNGNRTMAAPTNLKVGTYLLHVIQDGTGSRTITWNSVFKWPAGVAPVLTTTAAARDLFSFVCDGTNLYGSFLPDVK
jgi:hypothetical protein